MIASEDDLWSLFGGRDPTEPGLKCHSFQVVKHSLLDYTKFHQYRPKVPHKTEVAKAKKLIKQTPLKDTSRFYLLIGRERQVCVDQSRLVKVGRAMRDPELSVQYLGTTP